MNLSTGNSEGFDRNVIEMAFQAHESPFWDAKGELYRFNAGGKKEEILAMMVKHLIAFANISRISGKPCYMIFGINDKTWSLQDVRDQFVARVKPEYWDDESIPITKKQGDGVDGPYQNYAREYIGPLPPRIQLEYGTYKEVFVSYFKIIPEYPTTPYRLKKRLGNYVEGTVFCRYGPSTIKVDITEAKNLFRASETTYIEPEQWRSYLKNLRSGEFAKGDARATFPIRLPSGENAKDGVLKILGQNRKSIVVIGPAGQGKTTLLQQLTYIVAGLHDLEQIEFHSEFGSKEEKVAEDTILPALKLSKGLIQKIPFYMELRTTFSTFRQFDDLVCAKLREFFDLDIHRTSGMFKIPNTNWVLFLDGADEIRNRSVAGKILGQWIENLPSNVQVVVTSRPYAADEKLCTEHIELASLQSRDIDQIINSKIYEPLGGDAQMIQQILEFIRNSPGLYEVLNNLRGIDGFVQTVAPVVENIPAIDRDPITVINVEKPETQSLGSLDTNSLGNLDVGENSFGISLPKIGMNDIENELPEREYSDEDKLNTELFLRTAQILDGIFEFQVSQEVKRQRDFGCDPKDLASHAFHEARRIAWESDWLECRFNSETVKAKKRLLKWNRFIGFIQRDEHPWYRFYAKLANHYLAASFLYQYRQQRNFELLLDKLRNGPSEKTQVGKLYNEICIQNGKNDFLIQEEQL